MEVCCPNGFFRARHALTVGPVIVFCFWAMPPCLANRKLSAVKVSLADDFDGGHHVAHSLSRLASDWVLMPFGSRTFVYSSSIICRCLWLMGRDPIPIPLPPFSLIFRDHPICASSWFVISFVAIIQIIWPKLPKIPIFSRALSHFPRPICHALRMVEARVAETSSVRPLNWKYVFEMHWKMECLLGIYILVFNFMFLICIKTSIWYMNFFQVQPIAEASQWSFWTQHISFG